MFFANKTKLTLKGYEKFPAKHEVLYCIPPVEVENMKLPPVEVELTITGLIV